MARTLGCDIVEAEKGRSSSWRTRPEITFMRPVLPEAGQIRAEGTILRSGRRIGYAEGKVTDSAENLLAHTTTSCMILERALQD